MFQAIYMFYALAIVCDDYFVPSLEKISEVRKISTYLQLFIIYFDKLLFNYCLVFVCFSPRTCISVKMWLVQHLWLQEALLQSFLRLSLVSRSDRLNHITAAPNVFRLSFHLFSTLRDKWCSWSVHVPKLSRRCQQSSAWSSKKDIYHYHLLVLVF